MALTRRALFASAALVVPAAALGGPAVVELGTDGWPKCRRWPACVFKPRGFTLTPEECGGTIPDDGNLSSCKTTSVLYICTTCRAEFERQEDPRHLGGAQMNL